MTSLHSTSPQGDRRRVRIEYRLRPDVDLERVAEEIRTFVAGIAGSGPDRRYASYQDASDPRHFVHFGDFPAAAVAALQAEPFFVHSTAFLRQHCEAAPVATQLVAVASTR